MALQGGGIDPVWFALLETKGPQGESGEEATQGACLLMCGAFKSIPSMA